jgi:rubrerythrin
MNIYKFAMDKEKLSEEYYRQLAGKTVHKGLINICNMLADEENIHYKIIEQLSRNIPYRIAQSHLLSNAKDIFDKMREPTENFNFNIGELDLYQKALDIEKESIRFYQEKAQDETDAYRKGIFKKLANEEQKHYILLEHICEFVARPMWFLENAEMNRFDDYVEGVL